MNSFSFDKKALLWGTILGLLGFAGNWFKFELFFNVDFLFGSLFVMVAIIRFGAAAGTLAGLIASSCTFFLWNHPWAIIIMTAEAAFVGWRLSDTRRNCLSEDIIYWLFLGAPLVWLFYAPVLNIGTQSTTLIILKQSINGVLNALLASVIHLVLRLRDRTAQDYPSVQEILFITMVTIILLPSFFSQILKVRDEMSLSRQQIRETVAHAGASASVTIEQWPAV